MRDTGNEVVTFAGNSALLPSEVIDFTMSFAQRHLLENSFNV